MELLLDPRLGLAIGIEAWLTILEFGLSAGDTIVS